MNLTTKDYFFVGIQLILFVLYIFDISIFEIHFLEIVNYFFAGIAVLGVAIFALALLQLNKNLSPFPTPKSNSELIQTGLYKYIRHPIYTGILLAAFGNGFYINSLFKIMISLLILILFYYKSSYEEERLSNKFSDYKKYIEKSGRFLPKL